MMTALRNFLETPHLLDITQLVLAGFMIVCILLQSQGSGLGSTFGGGDTVYRTKRGLEKGLLNATIVFSTLFFVVALLNVLF